MNRKREICLGGERCAPDSLQQGLLCAFVHDPVLTFEQVCKRTDIHPSRARRLYSETQPAEIRADELCRVIRETKRHVQLLSLLAAEHKLDEVIAVVLRPVSGDVNTLIKEFGEIWQAGGAVSASFLKVTGHGLALPSQIDEAIDHVALMETQLAEYKEALRIKRQQARHRPSFGERVSA